MMRKLAMNHPSAWQVFEPRHRRVFSASVLTLDAARETARIAGATRKHVLSILRRRGVVVGLSGGIDSSVVAALCVQALGKDRVLGLMMPEHHSAGDSLRLGQ